MPRVLIATSDSGEQKILLDKERIVVGRDKNCDLFLDGNDVSRKHAAIINKHGAVYVENISSTGRILRGKDPVEYVELAPGEEIAIGPYRLSWKDEAVAVLAVPAPAAETPAVGPSNAAENNLPDMPAAPAGNGPLDEPQGPGPDFVLEAGGDGPPAMDDGGGENPPALAGGDLGLDLGNPPGLSSDDNGGDMLPVNSLGLDATSAFAADGSTRISDTNLSATLKIVKGEESGREIRLGTDQDEWIVGRGSKCDVPIDNPKLSRQHFKITREGRVFKVVDLESAAGTLLNGLSVKDAALTSFDILKIGPIEIQFIVGESSRPLDDGGRLIAGESALAVIAPAENLALREMHLESGNLGNASGADYMEKTAAFAAPVPYNPGAGFSSGINGGQGSSFSFNIPNPNAGYSASSAGPNRRPELPPSAVEKIKVWIDGLNDRQRVIYSVLLAVLVGAVVLKLVSAGDAVGPAPTAADPNIAVEAKPADKPAGIDANNAAIVGDVNPKFFQLTTDKRSAVEDAYAKAERAYQAKNWNDAYRYSKEVLDQVDPYKKANEILYESQLQKNNNMLGNVSTSLNNVGDAAKENSEKLDILVEAGEKALGEARWEDAEENFLRAVTLDPNNKRAQNGYVRARARDLSASINLPDEQVKVDPDAEKRQAVAEEFIGYRKLFNDARQKGLQGNFGSSLQILKQLDLELRDRSQDFKDSRTPASVREFGMDQTVSLQMQIRELMDNAKMQLEAAYQTQLADAEAFSSNKQYVQAKEIYNKILRLEPEFEKVKVERSKLYAKILSEAKEKYQESLIYETVGDIDQAVEGFEQARDLLTDVDEQIAIDYYKKSALKIRRLKR